MFRKQFVAFVSSIPSRLLASVLLLVGCTYLWWLIRQFVMAYKPNGLGDMVIASVIMYGGSLLIRGMFFGAFAIAVYAVSLWRESKNSTTQYTQ